MIKIDYSLEEESFKFSSVGHANYADKGSDIVCSAVSSIIIGAFNALEDNDYDYKIGEGNVRIEKNKKLSLHDKIVIETMIIQLQTVEEEFKKNLKITRRK